MKAEEIIQKLTKNGLEYRSSDFKAEVHLFGQIVGASNIIDSNGLFCEAFFDAGPDWQLLCPSMTIQTQTAYNDVIYLLILYRYQVWLHLHIHLIYIILHKIYMVGQN